MQRLMEMKVAKLAEVEQEAATLAAKVDRLAAMQVAGMVPAPSEPLLIHSGSPRAARGLCSFPQCLSLRQLEGFAFGGHEGGR